MTTNNKKLEEIPSIAFDLAEVMQEWYSCECDGNRTYFANKAAKFFQKKLNSLLQKIEEKIIGEDEDIKTINSVLKDVIDIRNELRQEQRKALKTIKERYL